MDKVFRLKAYKGNLAFKLALVEEPANGVSFVRLSKNAKVTPQRVLLVDEKEHILHGPIFRANYPFRRLDPNSGQPAWAYFTPEDIKEIVLQATLDGSLSDVILDHGGKPIKDLVLLESYRVTNDRPEVIDGVKLEPGSWMVSLQATTQEAWSSLSHIKQTGFSPEYFSIYEEQASVPDCLSFINLKEMNKVSIKDAKDRVQLFNIYMKNGVISKAKLESIETDKGTLASVNEEETIAEGVAVVLIPAEGEPVVPEDGEYISADFVYTVQDGVVISKVEKSTETPTEEALAAQVKSQVDAAVKAALSAAGIEVKPVELSADEKIAKVIADALKPINTELANIKVALKKVEQPFVKETKSPEAKVKAQLNLFKPRYQVK